MKRGFLKTLGMMLTALLVLGIVVYEKGGEIKAGDFDERYGGALNSVWSDDTDEDDNHWLDMDT